MGILEALSYGIPCLITEGAVLGEYINNYNAGWVSKTDSENASALIKKAISEKNDWQEKSNGARKLIRENFTWNMIAKETINEYKKLLLKKGFKK